MYFVYAGYEQSLNRRSLEEHDQIYVVKFGFCDGAGLAAWEGRFNHGYRHKVTGEQESLPLALCTGWRRIATVEVGEWTRASPGIERRLLDWADARFGAVQLLPALHDQVAAAHLRWRPGTRVNKNGLGELRHIPPESVPDLLASAHEAGVNDPLAEALVRQVGEYLCSELAAFAGSLRLVQARPTP